MIPFPKLKVSKEEPIPDGKIIELSQQTRRQLPFVLAFTEEEMAVDDCETQEEEEIEKKLISFAKYIMKKKVLPKIESANEDNELSAGIVVIGGLINILQIYELDIPLQKQLLYYLNFQKSFCNLDPTELHNYSEVIKDYIYCGSEFGLYNCSQTYSYNYGYDMNKLTVICSYIKIIDSEIKSLTNDPSSENFSKLADLFTQLFDTL